MFVGMREITSAKGRFGLIAGTVALITLLVVVLTGLTAGLGKQNTAALEALLGEPFYARPLPRSTGREHFDGEYVRRWAPALSTPPIVDLKESRQAALDAYAEIKD